MAISIRGLTKLNVGLANSLFCKTNFFNAGLRFLYTEKSLGVGAYENVRYNFRNQFMTIEDTFRNKMVDVCNKEDGIVFTEDLKAMIHLAQKTEDDLKLIEKMVEKFVTANKSLKFGLYVFGPVLMRMYYFLNEPQIALSMYNNPTYSDFFDQKSTLLILMSLLFKHKMYNDITELYEKVLGNEKQFFIARATLVIAMAACYKQNTPESFEFAMACWKKLTSAEFRPSCRTTTLLAALALNQGNYNITLEILSLAQRQQFVDVRCIKILAYMHLGKYLQMIPIFKSSLEFDGPPNKQTFFADVLYAVEESLKNVDIPEREELLYLIDNVKKQERVTTHLTLEENLLKPLIAGPREPTTRTNTYESPMMRRSRGPIRESLRNFL